MHVYFNADASDETGGFGDQWTDANCEFMLETAFMADTFTNYDPALFKWWGEVGGTGWLWSDPDITPSTDNMWGAIVGENQGIGGNAAGEGNKFECALLKEMMAGYEFADEFTLGVDIQQEWASVGVLPNAPATDDNPNGLAEKLLVKTVK